MAWIFLAESVQSVSPSRIGLNQSLIVSQTDMPSRFFCAECGRGYFGSLQSGTTCGRCGESSFVAESIYYTEASPVRISALQECERAWMESEAGFSLNSRGWLAKFNQNTRSWRTPQESLLPELSGCSLSSFRFGTIVDGQLYQPKRLEPRFLEKGGFASQRRWPRPLASDGEKGGPNHHNGGYPGLSCLAVRWAGPTARDWKGQNSPKRHGTLSPSIDIQVQETGHHGYLSPLFHEVMMGFPEGWTELDAQVTHAPSFSTEKHLKS